MVVSRETKWLHIRRGLALAASVLEVIDDIPMRCSYCRERMGLPADTDAQLWHDDLADKIALAEVYGNFRPRCPECRTQNVARGVLKHG